MQTLMNAPALVKIIISFMIIIIITRVFKRFVLALGLGSVVLALWSGHSAMDAVFVVWRSVSAVNTLFLTAIVILVVILGRQMQEAGVLREMVSRLQGRLSRRLSMAVLPAVIGLLPMPGGALFSAPLVDGCDERKEQTPLLKTQINFWFRHIWEFWWPLYPGVLIALAQSGLPFWEFALLQTPLTIFAVAGGYVFFLRKINPITDQNDGSKHSFIILLLPVFVIITVYAALKIFFPPVERVSTYLPMAIGVVFAIIVLFLQKPMSAKMWKKVLFSRKIGEMALVVLMIRIYGAFLETKPAGGILLTEAMRMELAGFGIPVWVTIIIISFISGITTGLAVGFVGASFPLVISLLGQAPPHGLLLSAVSLAYGFGYVGMLLSPVHVCLVVTNEYFKTDILHSIRSFLKPSLFIVAGAFLISSVPQILFGVSVFSLI